MPAGSGGDHAGAARADRTVSVVLFLVGLGLGAAGAVAGLVLPGQVRAVAAAVLTSSGCGLAFTAAAKVLIWGNPATARSAAILPLTGVVISLDRFGAVFAATTAVVGVAASCYSAGYLARGHRSRATSALLPLFVTSLLLVPAAASVATFMAAWELMALSSLLLLLTGHRRAAGACRRAVVRGDDPCRRGRDPARAGHPQRARRRPVVRRDPGPRRCASAAGPLGRVRARPGGFRVQGRARYRCTCGCRARIPRRPARCPRSCPARW